MPLARNHGLSDPGCMLLDGHALPLLLVVQPVKLHVYDLHSLLDSLQVFKLDVLLLLFEPYSVRFKDMLIDLFAKASELGLDARLVVTDLV